MFPGFFIGSLFLFLLVRAIVGGPRYRFYRRHAPPWGWGPYGREESLWGDFSWDDVARSPRPTATRAARLDDVEGALERLVRAFRDGLGATPSQERVFETAVRGLRDVLGEVRARLREARADLARAVAAEPFDERAFDGAYRRLNEAVQTMREAAREALLDVHEALDARQRELLARMIESQAVDLS